MKSRPLRSLIAASVSLALTPALWAAAPAAPAAAPTAAATPAATPFPLPKQEPDVAAPKYSNKTGEVDKGFLGAHERYVAIAKEGKGQLLFLGDSITAGWAGGGKNVWAKAFPQWQPVNFGIGGDRTQHVLWRIENGELADTFKPKACVLMIGTNNVGADSAEGIAKGVTKIVDTIRAKTPNTKILLLAVFPRGEKASPNPGREKLAQVNKIISKLNDDKHVFYMDIGEKFLQPDGTLPKDIMPDALHPNEKGYQIWADAITPKLTELMK